MTYLLNSSIVRWLILLSMSLLLMTCKREEPLPLYTQSGQNTLGCLINGKSYIPDGGGSWSGIKPVNGGLFAVRDAPYTIGIFIRTYAKDKQRIAIFLNDYKLGPHLLNSTTPTMPASLDPKDYGLYESGSGETYVTSSKYTGVVTITKADTVSGIVAGSFSFKAANSTGQTVSISQGRFDVNARTQ